MSTGGILVVEPDVLVRHPLAEYLRECGYQVVEAFNADEARQLLTDGRATIDVVLADVDSLGDSGFTLASWIRKTHAAVDVILAGTVAKVLEKAGELCHAGPSVQKPYHHEVILDRIRRLRAARDRCG